MVIINQLYLLRLQSISQPVIVELSYNNKFSSLIKEEKTDPCGEILLS
jgi:hypothetical protein